jgi:hypothetical protein
MKNNSPILYHLGRKSLTEKAAFDSPPGITQKNEENGIFITGKKE